MPNTEARLAQLRTVLVQRELDALVIDDPGNRLWISGFGGSTGIAVVSETGAWLVTDSRYYERAAREAPLFQLERAGYQLLESVASILEKIGAIRVGFEAQFVTVYHHGRLQETAPNIEWIPTISMINGLRAVKDANEIRLITRAAELTDRAMEHAYEIARPGMTEMELSWALERFMRENGAEGTAFEIIVASGPNGALPHHRVTSTVLEVGLPIVIDLGARVEGYNADLTRTFCMGEPIDPDYTAVWDLVNRANRRAREEIRPGMTGKDADAIARDLITAEGYGDFFGHGLGHGVGIDIHELPRVSFAADTATLEVGNVLTVEPGIYLPDRFGVRIEDLVIVESDSVRSLSGAPKFPTRIASKEPA